MCGQEAWTIGSRQRARPGRRPVTSCERSTCVYPGVLMHRWSALSGLMTPAARHRSVLSLAAAALVVALSTGCSAARAEAEGPVTRDRLLVLQRELRELKTPPGAQPDTSLAAPDGLGDVRQDCSLDDSFDRHDPSVSRYWNVRPPDRLSAVVDSLVDQLSANGWRRSETAGGPYVVLQKSYPDGWTAELYLIDLPPLRTGQGHSNEGVGAVKTEARVQGVTCGGQE